MSNWNATHYQSQFGYVWQSAGSLVEQLNPQKGDRILDLGCGTGQLTAQIAKSGASIIGIDSDSVMIDQARANYPEITFQVADAAHFQLEEPVDAVFSNAALHWVTQAESAAACITNALKPGGRFIAELGGKGNVQTIIAALEEVSGRKALNPWYFPSIAEYAAVIEGAGMEVTFATLFERPTPLGDTGLAGWLEMFSQRFFSDLRPQEWANIVSGVESTASQLYQEDQWVADYKRLRIAATRKV